MKIRGNTIGTTIRPEKAIVKATNLTEEEKGKARANIGTAAFEKIGGDVVEEYNEITKAVEVSTENELIQYDGNAILKGYVYTSSATTASEDYAILKIPVQAGDIIRDKLITYIQSSSYASSFNYAFFFGEDGTEISRVAVTWDGSTINTPNYLDIRQNGLTAPDGSSYVVLNIKGTYKLTAGTKVRNGLTANIITKNADASLTAYDGSVAAEDYIPVQGGGEVYYEAIDDIRIPRYEDALGDIETALDNIIATQESLIGGDA